MQTQPDSQGIDWVKLAIDTSSSLVRIETKVDSLRDELKEHKQSCRESFHHIENKVNHIDNKVWQCIPSWGQSAFVGVLALIVGVVATILTIR